MNKVIKYVTVIIVIPLTVVVTVLYIGVSDDKKNDHASENTKTIVTSFYPLQFFAQEIVGEEIKVVNIGENADPHDFRPSTQDMLLMQRADLVIVQGADLEPWAKNLETQLSKRDVPILVISEALGSMRLSINETDDVQSAEQGVHDNHSKESEENTHEHSAYDPHTWLDPVLASETAQIIAREITALDANNSQKYKENIAALVLELERIDEQYRSRLSNCSVDEALISHDFFSYVAQRYGIEMHPIAGISTKDEPSVELLAQLREEAREGVNAILTDETGVKQYAETLARETGLELVPIDPLASGVSVGKGNFIDGLEENLNALTKAYACN